MEIVRRVYLAKVESRSRFDCVKSIKLKKTQWNDDAASEGAIYLTSFAHPTHSDKLQKSVLSAIEPAK